MKTISNISIFSLFGVVMNGWLAYIFLTLWLHPQASNVEMIYSLTILILFEFVLVHSGAFMSAIPLIARRRSWMVWIAFILFYGLFALVFNALVSDNRIIILYGAVVLNRMLPGIFSKDETNRAKRVALSGLFAMIYLVLFFSLIFGSSYIPRYGLTEAFLTSVDFAGVEKMGGDFAEVPHVFMCFGVLYYLILTLVDVLLIIRKVRTGTEKNHQIKKLIKPCRH